MYFYDIYLHNMTNKMNDMFEKNPKNIFFTFSCFKYTSKINNFLGINFDILEKEEYQILKLTNKITNYGGAIINNAYKFNLYLRSEFIIIYFKMISEQMIKFEPKILNELNHIFLIKKLDEEPVRKIDILISYVNNISTRSEFVKNSLIINKNYFKNSNEIRTYLYNIPILVNMLLNKKSINGYKKLNIPLPLDNLDLMMEKIHETDFKILNTSFLSHEIILLENIIKSIDIIFDIQLKSNISSEKKSQYKENIFIINILYNMIFRLPNYIFSFSIINKYYKYLFYEDTDKYTLLLTWFRMIYSQKNILTLFKTKDPDDEYKIFIRHDDIPIKESELKIIIQTIIDFIPNQKPISFFKNEGIINTTYKLDTEIKYFLDRLKSYKQLKIFKTYKFQLIPLTFKESNIDFDVNTFVYTIIFFKPTLLGESLYFYIFVRKDNNIKLNIYNVFDDDILNHISKIFKPKVLEISYLKNEAIQFNKNDFTLDYNSILCALWLSDIIITKKQEITKEIFDEIKKLFKILNINLAWAANKYLNLTYT